MRKEARSLKATLCFLHLIPGLGLLLLETKAGMPPRESGGGGSAYTELWEHILSASAGSGERVDQGFSWESEHPRKISQDVDSLRPPSSSGDCADERGPLGSVLPCVLCCWPPLPIQAAFCFLIATPWRPVSGCGRRKEARKHFGLTSTLIPALLQDSWMAESK